MSGILQVEMLTVGAFGLGTRWRETREVLGRSDSAEREVTSFNRTYTITHHKLGTRIDTAFSFQPTSQRTKVTIEFDLESPGMPPGILAPLGWAIAGKVREVLATACSCGSSSRTPLSRALGFPEADCARGCHRRSAASAHVYSRYDNLYSPTWSSKGAANLPTIGLTLAAKSAQRMRIASVCVPALKMISDSVARDTSTNTSCA